MKISIRKQTPTVRRWPFLCATSSVFLMIALTSAEARASNCVLVKTYKEAISCVLANHPSVLRSDAERLRSQSLEAKASQRPNLEFTGKGLRNLDDSSQSNGEMDISYTFELGGKRSARIEKARLEGQFGKVDFEVAKAEALLQTLIDLQRIKYLRTEADLVSEGIGVFEKILKTYRSRLRLSPEQDVSSGVFSLALEDYKIRRSQLATETLSLIKKIELQAGSKVEVSEALFPPTKTNWPDLSNEDRSQYRPPQFRLAETNLRIAEAEKNVAESEAWPDLKIGPDYEWTQGPSGNEKSLGLTLTLPLPIWNRNQGGIAVANAEATKARVSLSLAEKELEIERASWLVKYENGVRAMKDGVSSEEMRKRHQKLKTQFTSGLIPSSLVIEANRQILEFTKSKNEQELSTLEALWNIKRLQGKLEEEAQ